MRENALALRLRFARGEQKLAENGAGALRLLVNLAGFRRAAGGVAAHQQPLRIAEDAGERVAQLMRHTGNHLAERGEFFCLQEFGLKHALGGQVAINLDAPEAAAHGIENRAHGALEHARDRTREGNFFAGAVGAASQFAPALRKDLGLGGALG